MIITAKQWTQEGAKTFFVKYQLFSTNNNIKARMVNIIRMNRFCLQRNQAPSIFAKSQRVI